ncbi:hypothetical protein QR685DRAFT_570312 [Neurospora intermedia]|uniref:Uncharacterized protein n=1 Tax=Neurospora intermedia TaxID=5142 RepID=A0ABR3DFT8_NEUIN
MAVEGGSEVPWKKACCQGKRAVLTTGEASEQKRKWKWKLSCGREKAEVGRLKEIGDCWLARDRKRGEEKPQTVIFSSVCDVGKKKEKGRGWTVAKKERMETPDGKWRELRNIACSKNGGGRAPKRRWSLMVRARFWGRQGYGLIDWPTEL